MCLCTHVPDSTTAAQLDVHTALTHSLLLCFHVCVTCVVLLGVQARAIDLFHEWFNIYPLLVFPIAIFDRRPHQGYLRAPKNLFERKGPGVAGRGYTEGKCEMFFDLGAYGVPQKVC
jgi:hypothetical protein